jgi:hypothetical protein
MLCSKMNSDTRKHVLLVEKTHLNSYSGLFLSPFPVPLSLLFVLCARLSLSRLSRFTDSTNVVGAEKGKC